MPFWHIGPSQSFSTPLDCLLWSVPPPTTSNLPLAFLSPLYVCFLFFYNNIKTEGLKINFLACYVNIGKSNQFLCLSAYYQLRLGNERVGMSVVIVKTLIEGQRP